ncbi:MAG: MarR family transcriptional regulator [Herbinix sp.]|jgi:DNA-binding MarR family transcriptional regulator|nr:MarR family transcriptional regulator [Herbinix sp.]
MRAEVKQLLDAISEVFKSIHQRSYHKLKSANMYPGQPKILSLILANEGIPQKELSEKSFVKPASITGMLNKLEANKYVYRIPDAVDKRIMRVYLTPQGRQFAAESEIFMATMMEQLFEGFSDEELQTFVKLAEKMRRNMRYHEK